MIEQGEQPATADAPGSRIAVVRTAVLGQAGSGEAVLPASACLRRQLDRQLKDRMLFEGILRITCVLITRDRMDQEHVECRCVDGIDV